jgi:uncharacterized membrane protein
MNNGDEILQRLDKVLAILQIANEEAIERVRAKVRSDAAYNAILDATKNWAGAVKVMAAAAKVSSARSTTSRKIAELIDRGMLEKRGGGNATEYKSTGLI